VGHSNGLLEPVDTAAEDGLRSGCESNERSGELRTPRSHKSAAGLLGTSQPSRLGLSLAEIDAGDSSEPRPRMVCAPVVRAMSDLVNYALTESGQTSVAGERLP
jgi:hypothetical protein